MWFEANNVPAKRSCAVIVQDRGFQGAMSAQLARSMASRWQKSSDSSRKTRRLRLLWARNAHAAGILGERKSTTLKCGGNDRSEGQDYMPSACRLIKAQAPV